jgi:hypothetical protein
MLECEPIPIWAETGDLAKSDRSNHRVVAERLPCMNIGKMNFDRRSADGRQCITQGNAVMRQRARINDDARRFRTKRVNRVDQMALVVGLHVLDPERRIRAERHVLQFHQDVGERRTPVNAGFASAEQVEIRPIEDEHIVILELLQRRFARHGWTTWGAQLRTGSTMVMRRSSMIWSLSNAAFSNSRSRAAAFICPSSSLTMRTSSSRGISVMMPGLPLVE